MGTVVRNVSATKPATLPTTKESRRKMTAETSLSIDLEELPKLYNPNMQRIDLARKRQAAVYAGETPDAWPIVFRVALTEEQERIPDGNIKECFYNDELMLCSQLREAARLANSNSDGVPSIRANLGTGICLSLVGLQQMVFPDKMPWLQEHMTREQAGKLKPEDIKIQGDFARGLEQMKLFKDVMGDLLDVFCMDTQGPFDLAHLLIGDDVFMLMYDDPGLMHHIMEFCLEMGVKAHEWMKEVTGEPLTQVSHSNGLYGENMGIRICEDTTALLRRDTIDEFALPYTSRLAEHFGGAWIHYCGRNDGLTAALCECEHVRAINFGHIPGHVHDHPFADDMELISSKGKVYWGSWPRFPEESGKAYLDRMHAWSSRGALVLESGNVALGEDGFETAKDALEYWYSL